MFTFKSKRKKCDLLLVILIRTENTAKTLHQRNKRNQMFTHDTFESFLRDISVENRTEEKRKRTQDRKMK